MPGAQSAMLFEGMKETIVIDVSVLYGGLETPTKTMFQFCPDQFDQISFREIHCCWVRELTVE